MTEANSSLNKNEHGWMVILQKEDGNSSKGGKRFALKKRNYSFGSEVTCDIVIKRPDVERIHCILEVDMNGQAWIQPFGTPASTTINYVPLVARRLLCHDDILTISSRRFKYLKTLPPPKSSPVKTESPTDSLIINSQLENTQRPKRKLLENSGVNASIDYTDDSIRTLISEPEKKPRTNTNFTANFTLFNDFTFLITTPNKEIRDEIEWVINTYGGKKISETNYIIETHTQISRLFNLKKALGINFESRVYLISDKPSRSIKYMYALAMDIPILHYNYIFDCIHSGKIVDINPYLMPAGASLTFKKEMPQCLGSRSKFASGSAFYIERSADKKAIQSYEILIELCGGSVCQSVQALLQMETSHTCYLLIPPPVPKFLSPATNKLFESYNKQIKFSSIEFLFESIIVNNNRVVPLNPSWEYNISMNRVKFEQLSLKQIFEYLSVKDLFTLRRVSKKCQSEVDTLWNSKIKVLPTGVTINNAREYIIFSTLQRLVNKLSEKYDNLNVIEMNNCNFYYLMSNSEKIQKLKIDVKLEVNTIIIGFYDNYFVIVDNSSKDKEILFSFEGIQDHFEVLCKYLNSCIDLLLLPNTNVKIKQT